MPRPHADTTQAAFRIPRHWEAEADILAVYLTNVRGVPVSRSDVLREALARGMQSMFRDAVADRPRFRFHIQAFDGRATRYIAGSLPEKDARERAEELARDEAKATPPRWTEFRVFGGDEKPVHVVKVGRRK